MAPVRGLRARASIPRTQDRVFVLCRQRRPCDGLSPVQAVLPVSKRLNKPPVCEAAKAFRHAAATGVCVCVCVSKGIRSLCQEHCSGGQRLLADLEYN
jgi:hypothetical protein